MLVGISIGAINAAIIAGNPPQERISKLREFWARITSKVWVPLNFEHGLAKFHNWWGAQQAALLGQTGFYKPKLVVEGNSPDEISFYDTTPLRETLLELIDFEYLNSGAVRLCLGAVELASGEFVFFDSQEFDLHTSSLLVLFE